MLSQLSPDEQQNTFQGHDSAPTQRATHRWRNVFLWSAYAFVASFGISWLSTFGPSVVYPASDVAHYSAYSRGGFPISAYSGLRTITDFTALVPDNVGVVVMNMAVMMMLLVVIPLVMYSRRRKIPHYALVEIALFLVVECGLVLVFIS